MRRVGIFLVLALAATATFAAFATADMRDRGTDAPWAGWERVTELSDTEGVWRSRGYGWIWSVNGGDVGVYDESGEFCLESESRSLDPEDRDTVIFLDEGRQTIRVLGDNGYYYTFDRIAALPAACSAKPRTDPLAIFDAAAMTLSAHYPFFGSRNVDWDAWVKEERAWVTPKTSERELFEVIARLLSHIPDSHVSLEGSVDGDYLSYDPGDASMRRAEISAGAASANRDSRFRWNPYAALSLIDGRVRETANGKMTYGVIGDLGYLRIDAMDGYSTAKADRALKSILSRFKHARSVIIDLSLNPGGYDEIALEIASHFAAQRTIGYFKSAGDSESKEAPQAIYVEPSQPRFDAPVYLITGPETVSAAEVFVLAMRALPSVTQVGEPTNGSLSDVLSRTLPNGWELDLSNEVYLDSKGVGWEGIGIAPNIPAQVDPGLNVSRDDEEAARRLIDYLSNRSAR